MSIRFVVTGARGFLGSVFSLRAIERGHTVLALDDESRGENPIEQRIGDCYRQFDCSQGIRDAVRDVTRHNVDVVVHFAAATGSLDRPLSELLELNVEMTRRVYQDALHLGAKAFLWPTTSLALGVPDSPYVESKEIALKMLREVDADNGIATPLRFFNVAGAYKGLTELRKLEVHMLPMLVRADARREPFIINGANYDTVDGTPSRDFVHVFDVVEYLITIAEGRVGGCHIATPAHDGAIWLGKGQSTTVHEAVDIYCDATGRTVETSVGPRRAFDCGGLTVDPVQAAQFAKKRNGLAPAWVSIRDEVHALQDRWVEWRREKLADVSAVWSSASVA